MTYLVLARKHRPRDFSQLVGQEHVVRALTHALAQQRLHHAYLFTGTRGVGKTTLSRILAKALNCVGPDGRGDITPTPCNVCEACTAIDAGRFVDYVEMDAASNRGVDEMTTLLERAIYAPSAARFKVFMLDEVHMLTGHAFNAMLKTLEEPPPHLKFILATTDPQKVPVTVLSRCLQFNLKQMPAAQIVDHLGRVLDEEGIACELNALRLLAQGAHGSMRDALSLTDQAIAYAAGPVTESAVRAMLGAVDTGWLIQIAEALLAEDGRGLLEIAESMSQASVGFNGALADLARLFQRIALAQVQPNAVPDDLPEVDAIRRLARNFDREEAQLHYQIAITGRHELHLAPDEHSGFTMTLLRMLAFRPANLASRAGEGASGSSGGAGEARRNSSPPAAATSSSGAGVRTAAIEAPASGRSPSATPSTRNAAADADANASSVTNASLASSADASPSSAPSSAPRGPLRAALDALKAPSRDRKPAPANEGSPSKRPASDRSAMPLLAAQAVTATHALRDDAARVQPAAAAHRVPEHDTAEYADVLEDDRALDFDGDWPALVDRLDLRGLARELARNSEFVKRQGDRLWLRTGDPLLGDAAHVDKLRAALAQHFARGVRLNVEIGRIAGDTAAVRASTEAQARQQAAEQAFDADPLVRTLIDKYGGSVVPGSVKPL